MYTAYRRHDVRRLLKSGNYRPLDVMVCGVTGAGKSTTLNSLFRKHVAATGEHGAPETKNIQEYRLYEDIRLWDTPGLGDGVVQDRSHARVISGLLRQTCGISGCSYGLVDLALVIMDGASRDLGTTRKLLNDVVLANIAGDRVVVAINQADLGMKGRHWNESTNSPDQVLRTYLDDQACSVRSRVLADTGVQIDMPVCYSARHHFNIPSLLDSIIAHIPQKRRSLKID